MQPPDDTEVDPAYHDQTGYDGVYPPDWEARKTATHRQNDYMCQICGVKHGPHAYEDSTDLVVHHVVRLADGGSNRLSNLTTLCVDCHNDQHEDDITQRREDSRKTRRTSHDQRSQRSHTDHEYRDLRSSWLVRSIKYGAGALICLGFHVALLDALEGYNSLTPVWLLYIGYVLVLLWALLARTRHVVILYGLAGGYWVVAIYSNPGPIGSWFGLHHVLGWVWLPAVIAGGIWLFRLYSTPQSDRRRRR